MTSSLESTHPQELGPERIFTNTQHSAWNRILRRIGVRGNLMASGVTTGFMEEDVSLRKDLTTAAAVIILSLGFIAGGAYGGYLYWKANYSKGDDPRSRMNQIGRAIDLYFQDCRDFPSAEQGLTALWKAPTIAPLCSGWDGPYCEETSAKDIWGRPYVYSRDGAYYGLRSFGKDGEPGGSGVNEDLSLGDL